MLKKETAVNQKSAVSFCNNRKALNICTVYNFLSLYNQTHYFFFLKLVPVMKHCNRDYNLADPGSSRSPTNRLDCKCITEKNFPPVSSKLGSEPNLLGVGQRRQKIFKATAKLKSSVLTFRCTCFHQNFR